MRIAHEYVSRTPAASIAGLARWWTSASSKERYALLLATFNNDPEAPPLDALRCAIYLAETEAGETG